MKVLTELDYKEIEDKISSLTFPKGFKEEIGAYNIYISNLRDIYKLERLGGNLDFLERLKNNNHRVIRPYIENNI